MADGEFRRDVAPQDRGPIVGFVGFLWRTRIWWLAPILIVLLLLGVLWVLAATGFVPYVHSSVF